jgi:hypothetical protein
MSERLTLSNILDVASYKHIKGLNAVSDCKIPSGTPDGTFKFKRKGRGEYIIPSSDPINFSDIDSSILEEIWARLTRSYFDPESISSLCSPSLNFEIFRTYHALRFWEKTPGPKRYSVEEILRRTLLEGPTYAELLSDEWDFGIRRKFRVPGLYSDYTSWEPIVHYNELPPVAYLIRWKESSDDIEYMKKPLWDFDKSLIKEFTEEVQNSLPTTLELPSDIEILAEVKTSTTLDFDKMKTIPFYQGRLSPEGSEFSHIFKAKRSIIPVGPANTRDAVVTTIDTYNSIKWCDLVIGTLLEDQEESLVCNNSQTFIRRLKRMTRIPRRGEIFWLRDIKKCGLTFPRELFHIVQECLSREYPDKDFSRFDIYRGYSLYDENCKPIETVRGYCLGMANNLVTYIQCIISKMLLKRIPPNIQVEALYGNDDSCLKLWTESDGVLDHVDAMMVQCEDFDILKGLNIMTNDKKSFWSWWPILFEEYGHEDFRIKHSRIACALSSAMSAPDIKYAKLLTSSISLALWDDGDWLSSLLADIVNKWGYEFYPQECNYDYILGGWLSIRSKGMNLSLRMLESCPLEILDPMWRAMHETNQFQKEVIRPVLKGSVTKNYSVIGSKYNITYVDTDIYEVPELPVEIIYQNKEGYKKFYESIYKFNRRPYEEMSRRLRRINSIHPGHVTDRLSAQEYCLRNFNKLAIPESFVISSTPVYEIDKYSNLDCSSLRKNSLTRFLEHLKENHLLMMVDTNLPGSGEYPYLVNYDETPFTEKIDRVTTLDGDIPEGIYQFSTNPWLPLFEYVTVFDRFPTDLARFVEEKDVLPIWFMNGSYRNSSEISLAFNFKDEGESYVNYMIDLYRECSADETLEETPSKKFTPEVCSLCQNHPCGWDEADDIFTLWTPSCSMCILGDQLWRTRKLSTLSDKLEDRIEFTRQVPMLKHRLEYLVKHYIPCVEERLSYLKQESSAADVFFAATDSDNEDNLFEMFG